MATGNTTTYTGGLLITNFDFNRLFIWDNRYKTAVYTDSGSGSTLAIGTPMGRVTATGKVKPCVTSATDGSQIPRFILANSYTVEASADQTVQLCFYGGVADGMFTFGGSPVDTLSSQCYLNDGTTAIGTFEDVLAANGIFVVPSTENTYYDNQP